MAKPIGELQGWWAISQKLLLTSWPLVFAWAAWTTNQAFSNAACLSNEKVEARAYTDKVVAGALAQVYIELNALNTKVAAIPTEVPPKLWEQFVRESLADHAARLKALESKP